MYLIFTFREFKSIHKGKTAILHLCFGTEKNRRLGSKKARYIRAFRRRHLFCLHIMQRTVKIDIFVFGVKGSTAYKTGPSYWMPVSCAGLIFSSGKSFRHHTLSLSIKYETTSTYCFKRDLRNMRFPARWYGWSVCLIRLSKAAYTRIHQTFSAVQ